MKVILLENCRLTRLAFNKILEFELGFEVIYSGSDINFAIEKIRKNEVHIVVIDSYLAGLEGENIRKIKEISKRVKVVILTCEKNKDELKMFEKSTADIYLKKDINSKTLGDIMNASFLGSIYQENETERDEILNNIPKNTLEKTNVFDVA